MDYMFSNAWGVFPKYIFSDYLSIGPYPGTQGTERLLPINLLTLFLDRLIPWRLPELREHTCTFANNQQLPFFESAEGRKQKLFHDHFPRKLCDRAEARTRDPCIWQIRNLPSSLLHYWTPAGTRTHDPSTTDKKSSALPTPLLGPAETNTHIGFLCCIYPSYKRVDIVL